MELSKVSNQETEVPSWSGLSWPSWAWIDDMFRDGDWRRPFKLEEWREDNSMVIRAELPGVDPDKDVMVEIVDDELVITAHKSEATKKSSRHLHRSEFRYGSLTRSVPIPKDVDESKITATYNDGVLEVRLAIPASVEHEGSRRIEIKRG